MRDEYSKPNRAEQIWSHFSGMFGGDAVKRKFGTKPPAEWESALTYLTDAQIRHGLESTVKSGAEHIPTLPQFLHSCRTAREYESDGLDKIAAPITDKWGAEANNHFLAYLMRRVMKRQAMSPGDTKVFLQFKNAWADDMRADDRGDGLSIEQQKAAWKDCMERAAEQVAQQKQEAA